MELVDTPDSSSGTIPLVCRFESCMGYEKNCFLWFFFWCGRINLSDRAKRGLCCDRLLEEPLLAPLNLHTATRLSAIKISLLVAADARNVTPIGCTP